jgi:hypothetical protein
MVDKVIFDVALDSKTEFYSSMSFKGNIEYLHRRKMTEIASFQAYGHWLTGTDESPWLYYLILT